MILPVRTGMMAGLALAASACMTAPPPPVFAPVAIPFERGIQGHVIVPVVMDGVAGFAVLDNGASTSVIDSGFAAEQKLAHGEIARTVMRTLRGGFEFGQKAAISVGGVTEIVTPLVLDIELLSNVAGRRLLGIIGEEFFERHVVEVNFSNNHLVLHDRRTFSPPRDMRMLPLKSKSTAKTQMPATIEGETGHEITFDLGSSGFALIDTGALARRLMADGRPSQPRTSGIVRKGEFQRAEGQTITAREITFGEYALADIPTDVTVEGFVAPSDISLGVNALSRFDIVFDVGGKRMWMRPNATYGNPFPHPVIGVNVSPSGRPGALEVISVAPGSPAERAGLKRGDIIVRIEGADATMEMLRVVKAGDVVRFELADGSIRTLAAARFF